MSDFVFEIDRTWIDNREAIQTRLDAVETESREAVEAALRYLFVSDGPTSLPRADKATAEPHLEPVEQFALQWLHKRTDGKLRRHYGPEVVKAVKRAGYRCERCGFSDIRALHLEKLGDDASAAPQPSKFICICANCHTVEARAKEMLAVATERENARLAAQAERDEQAAVASETTSPEPQAD